MDRIAPTPTPYPMSENDRLAHEKSSYVRKPRSQPDEFLRLAVESDAKAKASGTLRPVPSGISRPLLSMAVAS